MESLVAIDPTTSSSPSSKACDNLDYVPAAYALVSIARADHGVTGHSPARDIIDARVAQKKLGRPQVPGAAIDDRHFGSPHRVRGEFQRVEPDAAHPFRDEARVA